jgi:hypothetical protein
MHHESICCKEVVDIFLSSNVMVVITTDRSSGIRHVFFVDTVIMSLSLSFLKRNVAFS